MRGGTQLTDGSVGVEESLGDTETETAVTTGDDDDLRREGDRSGSDPRESTADRITRRESAAHLALKVDGEALAVGREGVGGRGSLRGDLGGRHGDDVFESGGV